MSVVSYKMFKEVKKSGRRLRLNCCRKSPEGDKLTSSSESLQMREEEVSNLLIFIFFMHFQGEASKLKKFKTGLGRRLNDIVGDMQDIRDEGLHSLNELKVEYQVSPISSSELKVIISQKSLSENGVKGSSIPVSICIGEISICNVGIRWKSGK